MEPVDATRDAGSDAERAVRRRRGGLGLTLLLCFLGLALAPMTAVSVFSYMNARRSLHEGAELALKSVAFLKTEQIDAYFQEVRTDLRLQSEAHANVLFLERLTTAFRESGKPVEGFVGSFRWATIVDEHGADLVTYRRTYGYHDILLLDADGNILFSVAKEDDLGTNLLHGTYADTLFDGRVEDRE